ncbi:tRNA (N(6)-L-threonylcarbamoyladenosine(37)-C(2))-methylthiotransferase MtaB [Porphyromonas sp.]|uniref:tRNA (N(6)-L-threonylcarbamoyladenosine(37)-C(2))- methylthiotransferase MtaB n=1 Tax=Porphyromonas sp. TaxID=1924944 RepID=UPI0026DBBE3F|nr:tRNA (N(6)-L-threonylcarbamoyladenosine(37)-C(2))-methylthiotransferase MtaB [Porphyromonas sp.]MDO4771155.1 tRNA (N(6)-L-threonylcarbamoyladenosine(37)-C(2))-methylthiotransferase MtaB [Porphyromonas sp.]
MTDYNIFENKTFAYYTLGCKLNFAETSAIGRSLIEYGMRTIKDGEIPDLCLINTCSVTELADKKCRQTIRKVHRDFPKARIIVTGCYAQLKPEEVATIEGVDMVLGSNEKVDLVKYLAQLREPGASSHILHTPVKEITTFAPSVSSEGRTRHFLKVQDGCDYNCSYCTIPKARGRSRNGRIEELVAQARGVVTEGGREIVLTGVNVGDFGRSTGEKFIDLIKALDEVEGIERFRISSMEPNLITDEAIKFVAQSKRFAPHFHIPLQSGSDEVLKLMRRRYNTTLFRHKIETIKELIPHAFIGVDVIVGTRGERDEYFEECYEFIKSLDISQLHVFSYSERPGTDALNIEYSVDPKVKHRRSKRLIALSTEKLTVFYESQKGTVRRALFEHGTDPEYIYGFTDNYVRVRLPKGSVAEGGVCNVIIGEVTSEDAEIMSATLAE